MKTLKKISITVLTALSLFGCQKTVEENIIPENSSANGGRVESTTFTHWDNLPVTFGYNEIKTKQFSLNLAACRNNTNTVINMMTGGKILAYVQTTTLSGYKQRIGNAIDLAKTGRISFTKTNIPSNALYIDLVLVAYKVPTATRITAKSGGN
jgi:hypothetical protein